MGLYLFFAPPVKFYILRVLSILKLLLMYIGDDSLCYHLVQDPIFQHFWCLLASKSQYWVSTIFPKIPVLSLVTQSLVTHNELSKIKFPHSWQLSYKRLDQLWFSLMALGLHYYVKQGFKQKIFDPIIDNGLKLAFIDATYCHFIR